MVIFRKIDVMKVSEKIGPMVQNVFLNNSDFEDAIENYFEVDYLRSFVKALKQNIEEYINLYFYINVSDQKELLEKAPFVEAGKNICIIVDEYIKEIPSLVSRFDAVFQAYITEIKTPKNYFHFPLGYSRQLVQQAITPMAKRTYNVFFSGNLHMGRRAFYKGISPLGFLPFAFAHRLQKLWRLRYDSLFEKSYVRFTNGFASGLDKYQYSEMLYSSKIVLCPSGIANVESFRLYEALQAGCMVVSDVLPEKPFYQNIPIVQLNEWKDMKKTVENFVAKSEETKQAHQQEIIKWWEDNLSPEAIAAYVINMTKNINI
jgi:hypothetical protein